jgi:hypothetical protein
MQWLKSFQVPPGSGFNAFHFGKAANSRACGRPGLVGQDFILSGQVGNLSHDGRYRAGFRGVYSGTRSPRAEYATSFASRRSRVSSFLALMTHQLTAFR